MLLTPDVEVPAAVAKQNPTWSLKPKVKQTQSLLCVNFSQLREQIQVAQNI